MRGCRRSDSGPAVPCNGLWPRDNAAIPAKSTSASAKIFLDIHEPTKRFIEDIRLEPLTDMIEASAGMRCLARIDYRVLHTNTLCWSAPELQRQTHEKLVRPPTAT